MMKFFITFFVIFVLNQAVGQTIQYSILDINTKESIPDAAIQFQQSKRIFFTDMNGSLILNKQEFSEEKTIRISHIGYDEKFIELDFIKDQIIIPLSPKLNQLKETKIKPISPEWILQMAIQRMDDNHLVAPVFYQKCGLQEEFFEGGKLVRYAESNLDVYQFKKKEGDDSRPYYRYGSIPNLISLKQANDTNFFEFVIDVVGKRWTKDIYNNVSSIGYVKGINLLNSTISNIYSNEFKPKMAFVGMDTIRDKRAYHLQIKNYKSGVNFLITDLFIDEKSFAFIEILNRATDDIESISLLDFKSKAILWLFGIKFKIHKFYNKISFHENKDKKWLIHTNIYFVPLEIEIKKRKFMGYFVSKYQFEDGFSICNLPDRDKIWKKNKSFIGDNVYNFNLKDPKGYPKFPKTSTLLKNIEEIRVRNYMINKK